jgi:acyl carrier protein phosphodiesterase
MKGENWLWNYKSKEGIKKSLSGLVRRTTYLTDHETAFRLFNDHYSFLQKQYDLFFKDVKSFAKAGFAQLHL